MSNLVLTIACGVKYQQVAGLTHPSIKQYAKKINADFKCIVEENNNTAHWNKFQIHDLLDKYDRIIYFDTDLIIRKDCPNLFELVPEDTIGLFNEGVYEPRFNELNEALSKYQVRIDDWDGSYYNTGVMIVSKIHKELFQIPEKIHELALFEQSYINLQVLEQKCKVHKLDYKFNHMSLMNTHNLVGDVRHNSFIIHYAGSKSHNEMLMIIEDDLKEWSLNKKYKQELDIVINGNLSDALCSEPTVRFISKNMLEFDINVITKYQQVFKHIPYITLTQDLRQDSLVFNNFAPVNHLLWQLCNSSTIHPVDVASLAMLGMFLPSKDRSIQIESDPIINPKHIIFNPTDDDWWVELLSRFNDSYFTVIGKSTFNIPDKMIDLRNTLTYDKTVSLLSNTKMLISDESHFVDIASVFNSCKILLTGATHNCLPYRTGGTTVKFFEFPFKFSPKQLYKNIVTSTRVDSAAIQSYIEFL